MISVAMAAYKGEQYIAEQLRSILEQLGPDDEVVVSDDLPGGATASVVKKIQDADPRVRYLEGPGKGVICNFSHCIGATRGDVIFLADQDDVWLPGKAASVTAALSDGALLCLHDAKVTDAQLRVTQDSFFRVHGSKPGYWRNVLKNSYMGCCMAFRAELKPYILPIPENVPMHDQYIGLTAEQHGDVVFLDEPLILYRRHGDNVTGRPTGVLQKLKWRADIVRLTRSR